jgi:hypothetical protein
VTARKRTTEYVKALCEGFDEKKTRQNSITARFMGKLLPETICFVAGSVFLMTCFRALFHQGRHSSFAFHAFCLKAESGFQIVWPGSLHFSSNRLASNPVPGISVKASSVQGRSFRYMGSAPRNREENRSRRRLRP